MVERQHSRVALSRRATSLLADRQALAGARAQGRRHEQRDGPSAAAGTGALRGRGHDATGRPPDHLRLGA